MVCIFSAWRNWQERRVILRDIRQQQGDDRERLRLKIKDQLEYALLALQRGDHQQATELWTSLVDSTPSEARASPLAMEVILGLRRYDEAETLMSEGRQAQPNNPRFLIGLARVAHARGDNKTAIERCAVLRKQYPSVQEGYLLAVQSLTLGGQLDEAESLAEIAMKLFPNEVVGFLYFSRIAVARPDWTEALRRWQLLLDRFDHQVGYIGVAEAMRVLGRYDEAETVLTSARLRFPTDDGPVAELARLAEAKGDTPLAIERWKNLTSRFPHHFVGYIWANEGLLRLGALAEAEQILREAVGLFPAERRPLIELGSLLLRRGDFSGAADVWATLRHTFPDDEIGFVRGSEALSGAGRAKEADDLREEYQRRTRC